MLIGPIMSHPPGSLKSVENEATHDGAGVKVVVRGPRDTILVDSPLNDGKCVAVTANSV